MKTKFLSGIVVIFMVVLDSVLLSSCKETSASKNTESKQEHSNKTSKKEKTQNSESGNIPTSYVLSDKERKIAEKEVGKVNNEEDFFKKMICISLQKIKLGEAKDDYKITGIVEGTVDRIQMNKVNLAYLQEKVDSIKTTKDEKSGDYTYDKILTRWINGNFDGIVKDFKVIRNDFNKPKGYSDSGTDYPTTIVQRSKADEQQYIKHFFN